MSRCIRAGGGSAEPYAARHVLRFAVGLALMLGIALIDIRIIARLSWPAYALGLALLLLVARSAMSARARSAGSRSAACRSSRPS